MIMILTIKSPFLTVVLLIERNRLPVIAMRNAVKLVVRWHACEGFNPIGRDKLFRVNVVLNCCFVLAVC